MPNDEEMQRALSKPTRDETVPEHLVPPVLPARYWLMVDFKLMTLDKAKAAWAAEQAEDGTKYHPFA